LFIDRRLGRNSLEGARPVPEEREAKPQASTAASPPE